MEWTAPTKPTTIEQRPELSDHLEEFLGPVNSSKLDELPHYKQVKLVNHFVSRKCGRQPLR